MNVDLERKIVDMNSTINRLQEQLKYAEMYHGWTKGHLRAYAEKYPCPNCGGSITSHAQTCSFSDMFPMISAGEE